MTTDEWIADVRENLRVNPTDWGETIRVDVNQLGARFREAVLPEEERDVWIETQNAVLCDVLMETAAQYGGDLGSFAEWTLNLGTCYAKGVSRHKSHSDIRERAVPTIFWADAASGWGALMHAAAYFPKEDQFNVAQKAWQPRVLPYELGRACGLASAVITAFGGARQVFLAGLGSWDKDLNLVYAGDSRAQMRYVVDLLAGICAEAGGSRSDVVRLRCVVPSDGAGALQEEISSVWQGEVQPIVWVAERNQPFVEIQVLAVMADGGHPITHRMLELDALGEFIPMAHVADARDWEYIEAGMLVGDPWEKASRQVDQVLGQIDALQRKADIGPDDVCTVFAYVDTPDLGRLFDERLGEVVNPNALHLIPCLGKIGDGDPHLVAGLTARRLHLPWRFPSSDEEAER